MTAFSEDWLRGHQLKMARMRGGHAPQTDADAAPDVSPRSRSPSRPKPQRLPPEARVRLLAPGRPVAGEVVLGFSLPPSANKAWRNIENGKGRVRAAHYKDWIEACCNVLCDARLPRVEGPYSCLIEARRPAGAKGALRDVDNLIKPTLDLLKNTGMTADDRHCMEITARWAPNARGEGIVVVLKTWSAA